MTVDPKITAALDKLAPGGWSLTVAGFAARAMKITSPTAREKSMLRDMMMETGLEHRRVKYGDDMIDCWDLQK